MVTHSRARTRHDGAIILDGINTPGFISGETTPTSPARWCRSGEGLWAAGRAGRLQDLTGNAGAVGYQPGSIFSRQGAATLAGGTMTVPTPGRRRPAESS
jgi:hypothetical protein